MPGRSEDFPGLQPRWRGDGSAALYFVPGRNAISANYAPKTVRIDGFDDVVLRYKHDWPPSRPLDARAEQLAKKCQKLFAETEKWLADNGRVSSSVKYKYDGTFGSLINIYQTHEYSPYSRLARASKENADYELRKLKNTVAERRLDKLDGTDFWRWYCEFSEPAYPGGPERLWDAYNIMTRVRGVFTFGIWLRLPDCRELREILGLIRLPNPASRTQAMTYQQARDFIAKAHELGYPEMALAQALEFELTLRQGDVIGKWEFQKNDRSTLVWVGLRWEKISPDLHLIYKTYKRGRDVVFDLKRPQLLYAELCCLPTFPILPKTGPVIVDSKTGQVFEYEEFRRRWRMIARAAGIPDEVQNRDARPGGVSEARSAGADRDDIRQHAGHAQAKTTDIYIRETLEATSRVGDARAAYRTRKEQVLNPHSNGVQTPSNDDVPSH
jgi:integrase